MFDEAPTVCTTPWTGSAGLAVQEALTEGDNDPALIVSVSLGPSGMAWASSDGLKVRHTLAAEDTTPAIGTGSGDLLIRDGSRGFDIELDIPVGDPSSGFLLLQLILPDMEVLSRASCTLLSATSRASRSAM
eukprot:gnl/TRDRNA2_/TRDRNA2_149514_c2_seq1.p2 gnl/TRDRNA2_/TRDRNA2_149514_c2~~gnl/TRDRNA2_/TRDRNA2_149514_c2_seq1.p2  ORF type:complete len:132 (+),score=3.39 gnl/TRDRNA2_/TRDRNA2_149514_c2_seq1:191-586(+)